MAEVAGHLSVTELGERFRAAADARSARHVQAIRLLAKGREVAEVASTTAFGVRWVEKLLARSFPEPGDNIKVIELFKASAADDRLGVPVRIEGERIHYAYPVVILAAQRPAQ